MHNGYPYSSLMHVTILDLTLVAAIAMAAPLLMVIPRASEATAHPAPSDAIVVDAPSFWGRMPINDRIADAASLDEPWQLHNTALLIAR